MLTILKAFPSQFKSVVSPCTLPICPIFGVREETLGLVSDFLTFKIDHDESEDSYIFTSIPSARITSNRIASQGFPTTTTVQLAPRATRNPTTTLGQETPVRYEITQRSLKFKGDVNGIKIVATQIASKGSQEPQLGSAGRNPQPQGHGKPNGGFVNQNGAQFSQSVRDTEAEVSQSIEGYSFLIVTQDAAEVEGEVSGASFVVNQRVL
jgi:hypothetical protein